MKHVDGISRIHKSSVFFAPRGSERMQEIGNYIAQVYLRPTDKLIGIIGEAGAGKSSLIKGMFPGLDLTNDDEGLNVRPLPIMEIDEGGFYQPHTYHLDIRFESAFTQMYELADAINKAVDAGRRVVVEHFELVYPLLKRNASLLIGVGSEIIITRPTIFGPKPDEISRIVLKSIGYRKMAHTAEDLVEHCLPIKERLICEHGDVRHGFLIMFPYKPEFNIENLEERVKEFIEEDLPVQYYDEGHVKIGDIIHPCTGPRTHVSSTGKVKNFMLYHDFVYDNNTQTYNLVGLVGEKVMILDQINRLDFRQE